MNQNKESSSVLEKGFHFLAAASLGLIFSAASRTLAVEPVYAYPPSVKTEIASGVGRDYAILVGEANPQGSDTQVWFEYGSSPAPVLWSARSPYSSAGKDFSAVRKIFWLSGLRPETTYYYRAVAQNKNGTVYGAIVGFKTSPVRELVPAAPAPLPSPALKPAAPKAPSFSIFPRAENLFRGLNPKRAESSPDLRAIETKAKPTFINLLLLSALTVIIYSILRK